MRIDLYQQLIHSYILKSQVSKIDEVFGKRIKTFTELRNVVPNKNGNVDLLVVNVRKVSTRDLFNSIDLGCREHNSWFLNLVNAYDLVETPESSYILRNVNITTCIAPKNFLLADETSVGRKMRLAEKTFPCFGQRPLTLHEVLNLAFQYPEIFNKKIHGIQAYGSRFTKEEDSLNLATDDTLEMILPIHTKKRKSSVSSFQNCTFPEIALIISVKRVLSALKIAFLQWVTLRGIEPRLTA